MQCTYNKENNTGFSVMAQTVSSEKYSYAINTTARTKRRKSVMKNLKKLTNSPYDLLNTCRFC